jgi:ferritin
MKSAVDELGHAALYAVLNGSFNEDIFKTMKNILPLESAAGTSLLEFAQRLRLQGLEEAAKEIESVAKDENKHSPSLLFIKYFSKVFITCELGTIRQLKPQLP